MSISSLFALFYQESLRSFSSFVCLCRRCLGCWNCLFLLV